MVIYGRIFSRGTRELRYESFQSARNRTHCRRVISDTGRSMNDPDPGNCIRWCGCWQLFHGRTVREAIRREIPKTINGTNTNRYSLLSENMCSPMTRNWRTATTDESVLHVLGFRSKCFLRTPNHNG